MLRDCVSGREFPLHTREGKSEACCTWQVEAAVDEFVRIGGMSDLEAAKQLRKLKLDVLVDLNGHTRGGRYMSAHVPPSMPVYASFVCPLRLPLTCLFSCGSWCYSLRLLALRLAPVQLHYQGFPATMGASFIPWFIVDPVVAPPDVRVLNLTPQRDLASWRNVEDVLVAAVAQSVQ